MRRRPGVKDYIFEGKSTPGGVLLNNLTPWPEHRRRKLNTAWNIGKTSSTVIERSVLAAWWHPHKGGPADLRQYSKIKNNSQKDQLS